MNFWQQWFSRKKKWEQDLNEELRFHIEQQTAANVAPGMPREEARRQAMLQLGAIEGVKEYCREERRAFWLESLWTDVRYGARMLRKSPGFTIVAILTLAFGIGANTAIFSLIDSIMLRSLPVRDPQQLLLLRWSARRAPKTTGFFWSGCPRESGTDSFADRADCSFSYPMFEQIRSQQSVFSALTAFEERQNLHMTANNGATTLRNEFVAGDFFLTLGVRPVAGRLLIPEDDTPGAAPVAVLSYALWQAQFDGNSSIVGKAILIEGKPVTVAGVTAKGFTGLDPGVPCDTWLPLSTQPILVPDFFAREANSLWLEMVARPKPGVSVAQAQSAISLIFARSSTSSPGALFKPDDSPRVELLSLARGLVTLRRLYSQPLFLLMTTVGIILLIACANVAGLTLARANTRQKEVAVRFILGASRGRVIRQLLTESLLIVAVGGALGILGAYWGASLLAAFLSQNGVMPLQIDLYPDPHVLGFTFAVAAVTGILFGFAPAFHGTRVDLTPALKASGGNSLGVSRSGRRFGLGGALVVAQVALSIVVLAGAGLLIHTLVNLDSANIGFDSRNVLLFDIADRVPREQPRQQEQIQSLNRELQRSLASLPGVTSASYSIMPLLSGGEWKIEFRLPDAPEKPSVPSVQLPVGQNFFETMHIPLLAGRDFASADFDEKARPQAIIINRTLARDLFGKSAPLGRRFDDVGRRQVTEFEVIGIVVDTAYERLRDEIQPTAYVPQTRGYATFELRAGGDLRALIPEVRSAVTAVDSNVEPMPFETQTEAIEKTIWRERFFAWLAGLFGLLALALACIGLYGLLSYDVTQRTPEIGVRMALGAQRGDVLRHVVGKGIALAFAGTAIGGASAFSVVRYIQSFLYGVKPTDPVTFAAVALLLMGVAFIACYIPARRAMRVDPMVALRYE